MYRPMKKKLFLLAILTVAVVSLLSAAIPPRPVPARFVADFANAFSDQEKVADLEEYLDELSDSTGIQIQIVTVNDLEGESPFMYARNIGEEWGVGDENKNNGVVILIKPKNDTPGEVFIATGYGSECLLTDAQCSRIIDVCMYDYLVEGQYFEAAESAAVVCADIMRDGNSMLIETGVHSGEEDEPFGVGGIIGILAILLPFLIGLWAWFDPKRRAKRDIEFADTNEKLQKALAKAEETKLSAKDREEALFAMRENLYTSISSAMTPELQRQRIEKLKDMPLSESRIESIVSGMKEQTYLEYVQCQSSSALKVRLKRAVDFGNDEAELQAMYAQLLATIVAMEAAKRAAAAAAARERAARSGSSSHSSHRSYGGGHFGGGGAGRRF